MFSMSPIGNASVANTEIEFTGGGMYATRLDQVAAGEFRDCEAKQDDDEDRKDFHG